MSRGSLLGPLRTLLCPRPAIQAWRSARCFATEVSSGTPIPMPSITGTTSSSSETMLAPEDTSRMSAAVANHGTPVLTSTTTTAGATMLATWDTAKMSAAVAEHGTPLLTKDASGGKRLPVGVVVSAGKMNKTVKVRIPGHKLNKYLGKYFKDDSHHLVHDPSSALNIGDVISLRPHRAAKHVHHIVSEILVPFGPPISERPLVPTEREMARVYNRMRGLKLVRRNLRRSAAQGNESATEKLKALGLDLSAEAGLGKKSTGMGKKGQKLPEGVLPGGKHAVGKIADRTRSNKEKASKREARAEENLLQAK